MSEQLTPHYCADGSDCNHAAATSDGMTWVTEPSVRLVASTQTYPKRFAELAAALGIPPRRSIPTDGTGNVVGAGSTCYYSFDAPNPATADPDDYIKNIIKQGHGSVLRFHQATLSISASRWVVRELLRHGAGFDKAEASQRYIDVPPRIHIPHAVARSPVAVEAYKVAAKQSYAAYQTMFAHLHDHYPRKQAREAARALLPEGMETTLILSGNMQGWRHLIEVRTADAAALDMRILAMEIYRVLSAEWPVYFFDTTVVEGAFGLPNVKFEYSKV